ncbi:MAG TPA: TonB-dependent receptor [Steroidobacteraceae bacterium]|nr:TonB-dependent receptor [Steroidobacteraceae bacterium]
MRTILIVAALLPLAARAADDNLPASPPTDAGTPQEEVVVVTASRMPRDVMTEPASVSRIGADEIATLSPKHQADALNRGAGVYIQRGSGAESLTAIRSPVLAGAGACGAFLVAEDNLPIRPVGFCNLNEMFELNYEQAGALEVLRGPGSAMYGASAVHGIVNLLTPRVTELPEYSAGLEGGSDSFARLRLGFAHQSGGWGIGAYGVGTDAPGWRDSSGVKEAKLNLLADGEAGGGRLRLRAAGTVLNQETAGFIQGEDSYKDEDIARSNPNPEAFRDASSARVSAHWQRDQCFGRDCSFELAGIYRRSRMDFVQHFLIGKPLEHNAQTSYMVSSALTLGFLDGRVETRFALDAETADSELTEYQPGPATEGSPAANAIRPAGFHYDYTVDSGTVGATLAAEWRFADAWTLAAALRADRTRYDYDNHMIDGSTRDDGTPCAGASGCLYSRPADRTDTFDNLAPRLTLSWQVAAHSMLYLSGSSGFRPPEMTEMYRLQRQQSVADLDSEELDSIEAGWKFHLARFSLQTALYSMNKDHVILRDSAGFNVSNGSTRHRGFEYEARYAFNGMFALRAAGTWARHQYDFSRSIEGGETIIDGNDVDTAPRSVHNLGLEGRFGPAWSAALDVSLVGRYFLDAANTATYPGHEVANLRVDWLPRADLRASLRVDNVLDTAYADRADFAFGNYRYFPARGRAFFISLDYATH